jgi:curved DNA-binding protein CbpA
MKDYFRILGLSEQADEDDIRQAYRSMAKQFHPDVNKSPDAHEKFCEITEAYEFLMNHRLRQVAHEQEVSGQNQGEQPQNAAYEQFMNEVRERAKRQARMRYEKFKKQHEAFQESGINDIALLFIIFVRYLTMVLDFPHIFYVAVCNRNCLVLPR